MPGLSHVEFDVQDEAGNLFPEGTQVRWVDEVTAVLPQVYADYDGVVGLGNPFPVAAGVSKVSFYTIGGRYRLELLVDGAWTTLRRNFGIGTAREHDVEDFTEPLLVLQSAEVNAKTFGVVGDGLVDDTEALQTFFTSIADGRKNYVLPPGVYRFLEPLTIAPVSGAKLSCYGATLLYDGAATNINMITQGEAATETVGFSCEGLTLESDTVMTGGIGVLFNRNTRGVFRDLMADGGNALWHGFAFRGFNQVDITGLAALSTQRDGVQIFGRAGADQSDINVGEIDIALCQVGMRVGGGVRNINLLSGQIRSCTAEGLRVDQTLLDEPVRNLGVHPPMVLGSNTGANILIDCASSIAFDSRHVLAGRTTASATHGIHIVNARDMLISMRGISRGNGGIGIVNADATALVEIAPVAILESNTGADTSGNVLHQEDNRFRLMDADAAGQNIATVQPWFPTLGAIQLGAGTTYEFEGLLYLTRAAGSTSHTIGISFGGTATLTAITYLAQVINPAGNVLGAVQQIVGTSAANLTLTAANTATNENVEVWVRGIVKVNAGGTIIPQFTYSAAPGGVPTVVKGSFAMFKPLGGGTVQKNQAS